MSRSGLIGLTITPSNSGGGVVGSVWTPARDGSGNVLLSNLQSLPLHTWLQVAGPEGVLDNAIEVPHYAKSSGPADGSVNIVHAWSSAALDYTNNILYLMGGGHGDTSILENGIYAFNGNKLTWSRVKNRALTSAWQQWNSTTNQLYTNNTNVNAANGQGGGDGDNCPLTDGSPAAVHNYNQLVWIPPAVMGGSNVKGGIYQGGRCRGVMDLDTGVWRTLHYYNPGVFNATTNPYASGADWMSYICAYVDGNSIHSQRATNAYFRYELFGNSPTYWSPTSFGRLVGEGNSSYLPSQAHTTWAHLRERREYVWFFGNQAGFRVRYGAMFDASSLAWDAYTQPITLTSTDGSHLDFNSSSIFDYTVGGSSTAPGYLTNAGVHYDHDDEVIYVMPNNAGQRMYRVSGISGSVWTVERMGTGTAALSTSWQYTYGRFRIFNLSGNKLAVRVTSTTERTEVMRIN